MDMSICNNNDTSITLSFIDEYHQRSPINVTVLITILIFGVAGNGSILLLFAREKKLRDVNNALIINLACSDLLFLILVVPSDIFEDFFFFRPFGLNFCRVLTLFSYCSQDVSILSLVVLSLIRYRAVMHPMDNYTKHRTAWTIIGCIAIWIVSILIAIIPMLECNVACIRDFMMVHTIGNSPLFMTYQFVRLGFSYVLPLVLITCVYLIMANKLLSGGSILKRTNSTSARKAIQSRRRLGVIVLALIFVFAVSWMPRQVQIILAQLEFYNDSLNRLADVFIALGAALNPFVLYAASTMFRTYFAKDILVCLPEYSTEHTQNVKMEWHKPTRHLSANNSNTCVSSLNVADQTGVVRWKENNNIL